MARRRSDVKVLLLIVAMAAISGALWSIVGRPPAMTTRFALAWIPLVLMCAGCERLAVTIEIRGDSYNNNLGVLALALGLVLVSPLALLSARIVGTAGLAVASRRVQPTKTVFNIVNRSLETALATLIFRVMAGRWTGPLDPRTTAAMLVAVLAAEALTTATVNAAIALSIGTLQFSTWQASVSAGFAVAESALALLTLAVVEADWRALWLIGLLTVGVWALYRAFVRVRSHYASLELLYRFTDALAGATEAAEISRRTLELARDLLRATHAELMIPVPDGLVVHGLDAQDRLTTEIRRPDHAVTIHTELLAGGAVLMGTSSNRRLHELAAAHGWTDFVAVPLTSGQDANGVLAVANRLADVSTFSTEDLRLLTTFARSSAIALRVGELVDELRREAADKAFRAEHDSLTGLGNRTLITHRLEALLPAATTERQVALLFMDVDGFKEVNDALGHHTGDVLLVELARRLQHIIGGRGLVARLGGDEFAVVLHDVSREEAVRIANEVREQTEPPVRLDNLSLQVRVSTGIAFAPTDAADTRTLFQRADIAMYLAKDRHTGIEIYDQDHDRSGTRRLTIASDLHHALAHDGLRLYYQPQADLRTDRITGLEALARWPHPTYGTVPPDEFIPIAEQSGLIHHLTRWALDTALAELAIWRTSWPWLTMSVNISARNLLDSALASDVAAALERTQLPPDALTLELTESSIMADPQRSLEVLASLHQLGVRLAIDDFGTGYSSLAYLKRLPVNELKIDKSFVLHMSTDTDDTAIVRSTIDLAHNLGLTTVAEGVEDAQTQELIAALGGDAIQGYHLSRPQAAPDITNWLHDRHTQTPPAWTSPTFNRSAVA